jgi:hypothetical protein
MTVLCQLFALADRSAFIDSLFILYKEYSTAARSGEIPTDLQRYYLSYLANIFLMDKGYLPRN